MRNLICLLLVLCGCVWGITPMEVVVVYNAESELSKAAAMRYSEVRGIPPEHLMPLFGLKRGDVTREEYHASIEHPLLLQGRQRGLCWPSGPRNGRLPIRAMVLMPDLPLRVKEAQRDGRPVGTGQHRTEAAVDSELALLGSRFPVRGMGRNPLYNKEFPEKFSQQPVMMVCRIDGPDEDSVYRMINIPAQVEKRGLVGWTVVDNGGPYKEGDEMLARVAERARAEHFPLFCENTRNTLPDAFPLMSDVAVYFGWYANPANGPFGRMAPADFRLADGAVAFHLHSFSATSLYDGQSWVSALLKRGACVTAGNVAEPYLGACLNYDIFYTQLLKGRQIGEAALMATPVVSWQGIVLGDPLYRPFGGSRAAAGNSPFARWRQLAANRGALQSVVEQKLPYAHGALWAEMYAHHCMNEKRYSLATEYFNVACNKYGSGRDKFRNRLCMLLAYVAAGERARAEVGMRALLQDAAGSPYLPAIRKVADLVSPPAKEKTSSPEAKKSPQ
ncbi:MAG: TIGR03790 family protein [Akkermansia sp.]|nr:TIGR03790 family protein [Akkermansia sp.]